MKISPFVLTWSALAAVIPTLIGLMVVSGSVTNNIMPGITIKDVGIMLGAREMIFGAIIGYALLKRKFVILTHLLLFRGFVDGADALGSLLTGKYSSAIFPFVASALSLVSYEYLKKQIK